MGAPTGTHFEARKQHSVTASKDADGTVITTLDDGTTDKLAAALGHEAVPVEEHRVASVPDG